MNVYRSIGVAAGAFLVLAAAACSHPSNAPASTTTAGNSPASTVATAPPESPWTTGITWAWHLAGGAVPDVDVDVVDVDLFETPASEVARLEKAGIHTVCYLSAGTFEDGRPDAGDYPEEILGNTWDEWDERYVDITRLDLLGPILEARLDLCAAKGFSAVEPDNIDTYGADTGFALTGADEMAFARWIATQAHLRGLSVAQKNLPEFADELVTSFDFAITEDCFDDDWCNEMSPYPDAGKAVLDAEYTDRMDSSPTICATRPETSVSRCSWPTVA
jgi:hypothetical protein